MHSGSAPSESIRSPLAALVMAAVVAGVAASARAEEPARAPKTAEPETETLPVEATAPAPQTRPASTSTTQAAPVSPSPSWRQLTKNPGNRSEDSESDTGLSTPSRLLGAALVVLLLGGVATVVFRRWGPKIAARAGREILVTDTAHLAPGKTLHVVRAGSKRFLVAATKERVSLLGELEAGPDEDAPAREDAPA